MVPLEGFADAADGTRLVITPGNILVDIDTCQGFACGVTLMHEFKLVFFQETLDSARRIAGIIPEPMFIAIGEKD